jgi:anti-anti-sigma regulatory factor
MDTSGLALLLNVANRAASVSISDPSTQVRRVIESAGLGSILRMSP